MRHPLHALCPYFAMFPEDFVAKQLLAYTKRGDNVFDPFCGRGTTVLESLLNGRNAAGTDTNPVAACVAGAKSDSPSLASALARLAELEAEYRIWEPSEVPTSEFFKTCFHEKTLLEISFLRQSLKWKRTKTDRFLAAITLGCLHGESHKTENCLSNRMPRTISTKPDYSVKWWNERGLAAPERKTFEVLRRLLVFRLSAEQPKLRGKIKLRDARKASKSFEDLRESIDLVVTSPPYLDTTDYCEDQWLRLWFLGGDERPKGGRNADDRHTSADQYWKFLEEVWAGCTDLMKEKTVVVIRIGGSRLSKDEIQEGLRTSLKVGFKDFSIRAVHAPYTSEIKNRQTNAFRPGTTRKPVEHDFAFRLY